MAVLACLCASRRWHLWQRLALLSACQAPAAGAGGSRALLAGLGGGFGAGRVYERYNVALTDMQGGGHGIVPEHGLSIASVKDALVGPGGAVDKVKNAVGLGDKTDSGPDRA